MGVFIVQESNPFVERPYYSFNQFLRQKFGCRVHSLSLNAGFGCPNLDGTLSDQGCIFCSNKAFSFFVRNKPLGLEEQIHHSMKFAQQRFGAQKFIAYFQSFTGTHEKAGVLRERYDVIKKFPDIVGLCVSTRPDWVDKEKMELIARYADDYMVWLEFGLQTIHDQSLVFLRRNHSFSDFLNVMSLVKDKNILVGAHVILGIPGETREAVCATADELARCGIQGVKFHCLHVVRDTPLAGMYAGNEVKLLAQDEYVDLVCDFLERLPPDTVILRLTSDTDKQSLIAPLWINRKQEAIRGIESRLAQRNSYQGSRCVV